MKRLGRYIFFILCFYPSVIFADLFNAGEFYLDNGLRVIVISNHKAPIVKMMVWYNVGSLDENTGKGGLAHLLEHLMFRGTKKAPDTSFNDIVTKNGGEHNAFTSHDLTAYHEFVDVSRLEVVMALEADRMQNLLITEEAFARERDIVAQERQQRVSNNPVAIFAENTDRILWQNYDYGRPVSGTYEEIKNLQKEDAEDFYKKFYKPNNAVLVLSGDIDVETAKVLTEKYFGRLKAGKPIERTDLNPGNGYKSEFRLQSRLPHVTSARVLRKYLAPSVIQDKKAAYALMLFNNYLSGGENSYLNRYLILKEKAAAAESYYSGTRRKSAVFGFAAIPFPGKTVQETEAALNETVEDAWKNLTREDLEKEKNKIFVNLVYTRDNPETAAYLVGNMAALGVTLEDIETYEENIENVTLEDVKSTVRHILDHATNITGIMLPEEQETEEK